MRYSCVCDNCKEVPTEFLTDEGKKAYFIMIDRETLDAEVLMSSGKLVRKVWLDKLHPISNEDIFWCKDCFPGIANELEDDEEDIYEDD